MFKQVKSALFWYYLYKFRKRAIFIFFLLFLSFFSNAIYADIIEYLKLTDKLQYIEFVLISKWIIILFNLSLSVYLILSIFQKDDFQKEQTKIDKVSKKNSQHNKDKEIKKEKFTQREKEFLHKKKLNSKADTLVNK
jgi:predicted membrane protein